MSQNDMTIANQGFPATRADINLALQALASTSSGATAPSTTFANQLWFDTAANKLKIRNEANSAWYDIVEVNESTGALNLNSATIGATTAAAGAFTTLSATGVTTVQAGTADLPAITTTGDTNTGMFFPAADTIAFAEGGVEAMRIDSSGNLLVGTTTAAGRLTVKAPASGVTAAVTFSNSASTTLFTVREDGLLGTGVAANSPYNLTTANAANMNVDASGNVTRSTSSLKYKTNVIDATHGLAEVMQLRSVTYKGKNNGETIFGGLIAEEVHAAGLTEFVQYAEDGSPDALAYGNMVSLCIKAIQEQQAIITALTTRITALEVTP